MQAELQQNLSDITGLDEVMIIRREDIPAIHNVIEDGIEYTLGIHQDFKRHPDLARFMPERAKLSISWVRLRKDEVLHIHQHQIESMVIVTAGEVQLLGDKEAIMATGDIVAIPRARKHGFIGKGLDGFSGLSVQFEQRGLYEDTSSPLVQFVKEGHSTFDKLRKANQQHLNTFKNNPLFDLMRDGSLSNIKRQRIFFDCFQVFSDYFQKMLMNRISFTDSKTYLTLFEEHLEEEFGHNRQLRNDRGSRIAIWDPVLEATSGWFATKMLTLDNLEKIILVHMVVETSACVFYETLKPAVDIDTDTDNNKHLAMHFSNIDDSHANLGADHLKQATPMDFSRLSLIQTQGWDMLNAAFRRIADIITGKNF
jgi:quercetin dioxygenase-like cupin family protein